MFGIRRLGPVSLLAFGIGLISSSCESGRPEISRGALDGGSSSLESVEQALSRPRCTRAERIDCRARHGTAKVINNMCYCVTGTCGDGNCRGDEGEDGATCASDCCADADTKKVECEGRLEEPNGFGYRWNQQTCTCDSYCLVEVYPACCSQAEKLRLQERNADVHDVYLWDLARNGDHAGYECRATVYACRYEGDFLRDVCCSPWQTYDSGRHQCSSQCDQASWDVYYELNTNPNSAFVYEYDQTSCSAKAVGCRYAGAPTFPNCCDAGHPHALLHEVRDGSPYPYNSCRYSSPGTPCTPCPDDAAFCQCRDDWSCAVWGYTCY